MAGGKLQADFWLSEYLTAWDVYAHGITRVLAHKQTAYQDMYVVETGAYGKALVLDGKWQSCTGDEFLYHEALVHPAAIAQGGPRRVLVLGGGEGATIREVLRWQSVERVLMVDIDGEVVEACREHLGEMHANAFEDPRLELHIGDAIAVLEGTEQPWDLIISDLSDPIEEGPSFKLFTREYFERVRNALAPGGFFVIQAGPVAPPKLTLHARLANTVGAVFPHFWSYTSYVPTFASPWGFVLGSAETIPTRPNPDAVDRLLAEQTSGGLRMLDGTALLGLLQTPAYLRRAIAQQTEVYTMQAPPKFE